MRSERTTLQVSVDRPYSQYLCRLDVGFVKCLFIDKLKYLSGRPLTFHFCQSVSLSWDNPFLKVRTTWTVERWYWGPGSRCALRTGAAEGWPAARSSAPPPQLRALAAPPLQPRALAAPPPPLQPRARTAPPPPVPRALAAPPLQRRRG